MANDCLVTKLKATVDNVNMPYLGWIKVNFSNYNPGSWKKLFSPWNTKQNEPFLKVIKGTVYSDASGDVLTDPYPLNSIINSGPAFRKTQIYLEPNAEATVLIKSDNLWVFNNMTVPLVGSAVVDGTSQLNQNQNAAWHSVDFNDLANSVVSIIMLEFTTFKYKLSPIEKLMVKKFRYFKNLGGRTFDNQTTGYVPCIRNAQPTLIETQKYITWRGESFYNKTLYFNFDYDNDKINVFDTAEVLSDASAGYSVSHKIAEYSDTTKEWTFFE